MENNKRVVLPKNELIKYIQDSNDNVLDLSLPSLTIIGLILIILDYFFYPGFREHNSIFILLSHCALFLPNFLMWIFIKYRNKIFPLLSFLSIILTVFLALYNHITIFHQITVYGYGLIGALIIVYLPSFQILLISFLSYAILVVMLITNTPVNELLRSNMLNGLVATVIAILAAHFKNKILYVTFEKNYLLKRSKKELEFKKMIIEENFNQLKDYEKKKDKMLAAIAHELNTPLSVIYGHLSIIKKKCEKNEKFKRSCSAIERNTDRLIKNVSNILNLMKSQITDVAEKLEIIELVKYLEPIIYDYEIVLKQHKIKFTCEIADVKIFINKENLRIIIENLLDNAYKYSKEGSNIIFFVEKEGKRIKFGVKDEGIGISMDEKDKIFEEFYRAKLGKTKQIPGLGLGLSIVSSLLSKYGSKLEYTSELGKGSTFYFYLEEYEK